jgi:hypothetical protein
LIAIEKRWRTLREAHHALSQTLRMFDPDAYSHSVKEGKRLSARWSWCVFDDKLDSA